VSGERAGAPRGPAQILVIGLSVTFGTKAVLDGVNVSVATGEWVALIGPNGAGKTTMLRAIARMVRSAGGIMLGGQPASRLGHRKLARLIAYVPQHPMLPPTMTALDYVMLGRTPHLGYFAVESDADRRICLDLLDRMTLADMAGRRLSTMSGGEAQRLVLARALAQQAPILLLDEPTSALDLGRRVDALELIDELRTERSLTVLSAIHDLTLAGQFADRLVLLHEGKVTADGKPAAVLRDDVLSATFGAGVGVLRTAGGELAVISQRQHPSR
jgi:iron complex transport system ATP-binding protein